MPPVLGNAVALLAVAALVFVCARYLWLDHQRGGGCASCGGACAHGGGCASCHGGCGGGVPKDFRPIDVSALRIHTDQDPPDGT